MCPVAAGVSVRGQGTQTAEAPLVCKGTSAPVTPTVLPISDGPGEGFTRTPCCFRPPSELEGTKENRASRVCVTAHGLPHLPNGKARVEMKSVGTDGKAAGRRNQRSRRKRCTDRGLWLLTSPADQLETTAFS